MLPKEGEQWERHGEQTGPGWEGGDCHLSPSNELSCPGCPGLSSKRPLETDPKCGSCGLGQGSCADQAQHWGPRKWFHFFSLLESEAKKLMS